VPQLGELALIWSSGETKLGILVSSKTTMLLPWFRRLYPVYFKRNHPFFSAVFFQKVKSTGSKPFPTCIPIVLLLLLAVMQKGFFVLSAIQTQREDWTTAQRNTPKSPTHTIPNKTDDA